MRKQKGYIGQFLLFAAACCVVLGAIITVAFNWMFDSESRETLKALASDIEQCERDLPRTERCVLVAVPESEVKRK